MDPLLEEPAAVSSAPDDNANETEETTFIENDENTNPESESCLLPQQQTREGTTSVASSSGVPSSRPSRVSTASITGPGGRRLSRRGSIFIADNPFSDGITGTYEPVEPDPDDDDVFEVGISSGRNSMAKPPIIHTRCCSLSNKSLTRLVVMLLLIIGLAIGIYCGLVLERKVVATEEGTLRQTDAERQGIWNNIRLPKTLLPRKYYVHLRTDLTNFTFNGTVEILIECIKKTDVLLLHVHQSDLVDLSPGSIQLHQDKFEKKLIFFKRTPWFHEENQYLVMELKTSLEAGKSYRFRGRFSAPLLHDWDAGYFRLPYETSTGKRWVTSTLTALTNARKIFPCFDEPGFKANFSITLDHTDDLVAISNMPLASNASIGDGWVRSVFQESVPMSTYLVAWSITDFGYAEITTRNGVLIRGWAREDAVDAFAYSLQIGAEILDFFDEYFGTKFPLPKLDFISLPGFPYGGMENWGIISYVPYRTLYNEGVTAVRDKEAISNLVAHELAHQWFGNLVTMDWWADTWLNEGFASYVGPFLGAVHVEPDLGMETLWLRRVREVLLIDSLSTSRPITLPVATNIEIAQQFDPISYRKGALIIRMCSYFLGEDTFRKGLKEYLAEFAYGNANRDDLWRHLNQAAKNDGKLSIDVKQIMDTWTLQMGYPVVTVTREYGREDGSLRFKADQRRFLMNPQSNTTSQYGDMGYRWHVPLTYTTAKDANFDMPSTDWLNPGHKLSVSVGSAGDTDWLLMNVGAQGYYRVNYDVSNWQLLAQQLADNHQAINIASRSALIDDAYNLARAGTLDQVLALNITQYLTAERDYVPWATAADVLGYTGLMLGKTRAFGDFQKYLLHIVTPLYEDIGWAEPLTHAKRQAQSGAIDLACSFEHRGCIEEAVRQYSQWMLNPSSNIINPDVKESVCCTAIREGGQEEWFFAYERLQQTSSSDTEKLLLQKVLACTEKPWLLQTYLSYILDDGSTLRAKTVLTSVAGNPIGAGIAWNFFWSNWDYLRNKFGDSVFSFATMVKGITKHLNTEYELKQLKSLIKQHPDQGSAGRVLQQAVESTESNIRWMQDNYDDVAMWLQYQVDDLGL